MPSIPPEMKRAIEASFAADKVRERMRRMETGTLDIELEGANDDQPVDAPEFQAELNTFSHTLHQGEIPFTQTGLALDAIDAHGYPLAEFAIQSLGPHAIDIVAAAVSGWLAGRAGRKARVKFGEVEAEARTPEEVEKLLKSAAVYQASIKKAGKK